MTLVGSGSPPSPSLAALSGDFSLVCFAVLFPPVTQGHGHLDLRGQGLGDKLSGCERAEDDPASTASYQSAQRAQDNCANTVCTTDDYKNREQVGTEK